MTRRVHARSNDRIRGAALGGLVLLAVSARLLPHPPNFTPLGAAALLAGATFRTRWRALAVPLGAMLLSDLALEAGRGRGLHALLPVVYLLFAASVLIGRRWLSKGRGPTRLVAACGASATLFYLGSYFAVWCAYGLYPLTWAGLVECYVAALPFYGNDLVAHLAYSGALFGALALAEQRFPSMAPGEHVTA